VNVAVQFGAVPPKTILGTVTMDGSEVAATTEPAQVTALSTSLIVKFTIN